MSSLESKTLSTWRSQTKAPCPRRSTSRRQMAQLFHSCQSMMSSKKKQDALRTFSRNMLQHLSQLLRFMTVKRVPREMLQDFQKAVKKQKAPKTLKRQVLKMQPSLIKTLPNISIVVWIAAALSPVVMGIESPWQRLRQWSMSTSLLRQICSMNSLPRSASNAQLKSTVTVALRFSSLSSPWSWPMCHRSSLCSSKTKTTRSQSLFQSREHASTSLSTLRKKNTTWTYWSTNNSTEKTLCCTTEEQMQWKFNWPSLRISSLIWSSIRPWALFKEMAHSRFGLSLSPIEPFSKHVVVS